MAVLQVFVYGTLKRGQRNHDHYCRGATDIIPATTAGQLFELPFGFPGIRVPDSAIRAVGSADYSADARIPDDIAVRPEDPDPYRSLVHGELITFPDPNNLARLDGLEGYAPGEKGLYVRVLVPVMTHNETYLAWAYALTREAGSYLPGGRWLAKVSSE